MTGTIVVTLETLTPLTQTSSAHFLTSSSIWVNDNKKRKLRETQFYKSSLPVEILLHCEMPIYGPQVMKSWVQNSARVDVFCSSVYWQLEYLAHVASDHASL